MPWLGCFRKLVVMERSERQKMLAGEQYNCHDAELSQMAVEARRRVAQFCASDPGDEKGRFRLLKEIFGKVERGVHIEPPFYADYGVHTSIGEDTFVNVNCVIIDDAPVTIGRRVLIGPAVQLITAMHPLRAADRRTPAADVAAGSAAWRTMTAPVASATTCGSARVFWCFPASRSAIEAWSLPVPWSARRFLRTPSQWGYLLE